MHLRRCCIQENWNVFWVVAGKYMLLVGKQGGSQGKLVSESILLGFTL